MKGAIAARPTQDQTDMPWRPRCLFEFTTLRSHRLCSVRKSWLLPSLSSPPATCDRLVSQPPFGRRLVPQTSSFSGLAAEEVFGAEEDVKEDATELETRPHGMATTSQTARVLLRAGSGQSLFARAKNRVQEPLSRACIMPPVGMYVAHRTRALRAVPLLV